MCLESSLIHPEDQISPGTQTQDTFDPDTVNPDRVNPDMEIKSVCEMFTQTCTQEYELQITNLTKVRKSIPAPPPADSHISLEGDMGTIHTVNCPVFHIDLVVLVSTTGPPPPLLSKIVFFSKMKVTFVKI